MLVSQRKLPKTSKKILHKYLFQNVMKIFQMGVHSLNTALLKDKIPSLKTSLKKDFAYLKRTRCKNQYDTGFALMLAAGETSKDGKEGKESQEHCQSFFLASWMEGCLSYGFSRAVGVHSREPGTTSCVFLATCPCRAALGQWTSPRQDECLNS